MHLKSSPPAFRPLAIAAAAALALGLGTAFSAAAQTVPAQVAVDGTLLSISAEGEVKRAPDIARLSTGVVTRAADAQAAMAANAEQMQRVIAAIKQAGIAENDIQTSGVNLFPQYRHSENQPPEITGYEAHNTVEITVREIGKLGDLLDVLVAAGANQINGPTFDVEDKQAAFDEARRIALENARERARMYGQTLGMQVQRIVSISEGHGFAPPRPMPMMAMARMEKAADTPIEPGQSTLSVTLDVVFELDQ